MLFRSSVIALALAACLANGTYIKTGPSNVHFNDNAGYPKHTTSYSTPKTNDYTTTRSRAIAQFSTSQVSISRFGSIFENSLQQHNIGVVINGLVDIHASILSLGTQIHAGVGIWIRSDADIFVAHYVDLLAKLQAVLKIIEAHGQIDACHSSIVALNAPLQVVLSVLLNAGVSVHALVSAQVDLKFMASIGISLGISANVSAGLGAGLGAGVGGNVGAAVHAGVGAGVSAQVGVSVNARQAVSLFGTVNTNILQSGPNFERACKQKKPKDVISGLVDIRASILSLNAHVNAGAAIWARADLDVFAHLSVDLLVKLQVVLKIIQTYGQTSSCQSSIAALRDPLAALLSVCAKAGINLSGLMGAQVDLHLYALLGINLGISAKVGLGANASLSGSAF